MRDDVTEFRHHNIQRVHDMSRTYKHGQKYPRQQKLKTPPLTHYTKPQAGDEFGFLDEDFGKSNAEILRSIREAFHEIEDDMGCIPF